jgi:hypothetical protein
VVVLVVHLALVLLVHSVDSQIVSAMGQRVVVEGEEPCFSDFLFHLLEKKYSEQLAVA